MRRAALGDDRGELAEVLLLSLADKLKALLLIIGLIAGASPAAGQAAAGRPVASVLYSGVTRGPLSFDWSAEQRDSVVRDIRPTYWKEGALVAGLIGAAGGAVLGAAVCESKGCIIASGLGGALVLALPGALVGGQFRKQPTSDE